MAKKYKSRKPPLNIDDRTCKKGCYHWNKYLHLCEYLLDTGLKRECSPTNCEKFGTYNEYMRKLKSGAYTPDEETFEEKMTTAKMGGSYER